MEMDTENAELRRKLQEAATKTAKTKKTNTAKSTTASLPNSETFSVPNRSEKRSWSAAKLAQAPQNAKGAEMEETATESTMVGWDCFFLLCFRLNF